MEIEKITEYVQEQILYTKIITNTKNVKIKNITISVFSIKKRIKKQICSSI